MLQPVGLCGGGEELYEITRGYCTTRTFAALNGVAELPPKYSPRIPTVCPEVSGLDVGLAPSKLVTGDVGGVPSVIWTNSGAVSPKNGGRLVIENVSPPADETVPLVLVNRSIKPPAVAEAGVVPEAAVNAVIGAATVCPGNNTDVSVALAKFVTGIVSPFVSIVNGDTFAKVMFTGAPSNVDRLPLILLLLAANTRLFATS